LAVDASVPVSLNPHCYIDTEDDPEARLPMGAYGYRDAHPLARGRFSATRDYLRDRLGGIMRLVPGVTEAHVRLAMFERMLDDGVADASDIFRALGMKVDVWPSVPRRPAWAKSSGQLAAPGWTTATRKPLAPSLAPVARPLT